MRLLYVIQAKTGQIKVGLSMHPSERVEQFRIGSPVPIRLIAILGPGNRLDEINLQRSLDGDHSHGEWFLGEKASAFATSVMGCGLTSVADWPPASTGFSAYRTAGIRRGRETNTRRISAWRERSKETAAKWDGAVREAERLNPDLKFHEIYPIALLIFDREAST